MGKVLELYEMVKNIEGINMTLIDSYIRVLLKRSKCETIEELVELVHEKEKEATTLYDSSSELIQKLSMIMEEEKELFANQKVLEHTATNKGMKLVCALFGVMAVLVVCLVSFFSVPVVFLSIASLLVVAKIAWKAKIKIWADYNENKARFDELCSQESALNVELNNKLFESIRLNGSINELGETVKEIVTFLETYVSVIEKVDSESLTQDTTLEEVEEVVIPEEGKGKILH